ncbi:hypothetical protein CA13_12390 [Planctomycetes bacterium CA13]|uniref:Uncharacterized protein n=1 Tax=Novipirellula herctigrandis TaxID=2527986 RepID=A0A5C5YXS7_9BACT|nr:hypothetical protein CA13_12390 [Planctomycetes bacterium CA13]
MSPTPAPDDVWKDATALVDKIDQMSRSPLPVLGVDEDDFFDSFAKQLRQTASARSVVVRASETFSGESRDIELARDGIEVISQPSERHSGDPKTPTWRDDRHLVACVTIDEESEFQVDVRWGEAVALARHEPFAQMTQATAEIAATVYLKREVSRLRGKQSRRVDRDSIVCNMNRGSGLADSFRHIAQTISTYVDADRVCLLKQHSESTFCLIATSTSTSVDTRTRLGRRVQELASVIDSSDSDFEFTVGNAEDVPAAIKKSLDPYLVESGSRQVAVSRVECDGDHRDIIVMLERFSHPKRPGMLQRLSEIHLLVDTAIANALERDISGMRVFVDKMLQLRTAKRVGLFAGLVAVGVIAMSIIPIDFYVPAEGRVVAAVRRSIFAPTNGTVLALSVDNGDVVKPGDSIVVIRNRELETRIQQLEGGKARVKASLASAQRSRASGNGAADFSASATEQVLKSQLKGLDGQLSLLRHQQAELNVTSPIAGKIDHWDMRQRLSNRPIERGQFIADVIDPESGWKLEIEIDDSDSGYVLSQQHTKPCLIRFSLRSHSDQTYEAVLSNVDEVTHQNARGDWVVKGMVNCPVDFSKGNDFAANDKGLRAGATAKVEVFAGRRAIGFVWFRGLIEWIRAKV